MSGETNGTPCPGVCGGANPAHTWADTWDYCEDCQRAIEAADAGPTFQRLLEVFCEGIDFPPCRYERHRPSDWRQADGGPWRCGVCHPPAAGLDILFTTYDSSAEEDER